MIMKLVGRGVTPIRLAPLGIPSGPAPGMPAAGNSTALRLLAPRRYRLC
jgi:hypothetical protein